MIVGIESPIRANENLHRLEAGKLVLFSSPLERGARLGVLARDEPLPHGTQWSAIRALVLRALPANETALLRAWVGSPSAMTATRAEMQRLRSTKAGLAVETCARGEDTTLYVTARKTALEDLALPLPIEGPAPAMLLQLPTLDLETFATRFAPDLAELATRELAPSLALIEHVLDRRGALAYHVKDDLGRTGLVIVGELTIPTDLEALGARHVYRDAEAGLVFRQGFG